MRLSLLLIVVLAITSIMLTGIANRATAELNRAEVESIVREYIEENGGELLLSIQAFQDKRARLAAMESIRPYSPVEGAADAPITIIEFSEFQCPFCGKAQPTITALKKRYGNKIRHVYKHLPLGFHPQAVPAAYASMAAHEQGKFWEYAEKLWAQQNYLGDKLFVSVAKDIGLDMKKFEADRTSQKIADQLKQDQADAESVGARGTPFFSINGVAVSGAQPEENFVQLIEALLAEQEK